MNRGEVLESIRAIISPVLANLGYDLVEIALVVSHGRRTLRVFIDRADGVTLDDCARVSKALGALLDQRDIVRGRYYLEVSSPGAERRLRTREDYRRFVGRKALVRLREKIDGLNAVVGRIERFEDDRLDLKPEGSAVVTIPFATIASANLCL